MDQTDEAYLREYKKIIRVCARIAADSPDMVGQMRVALETSAALMTSNKPELTSEFRETAKELDAFLRACETGTVNPRSLLERLDFEAASSAQNSDKNR